MIVHIDFETRSRVDISKSGAYKYAMDPSTEVLCVSYAIDDGQPRTLKLAYGFELFEDVSELRGLAANKDVIFKAFNANFERNIWRYVFAPKLGMQDIPLKRWKCVAAVGAMHGMPKSLEECSSAVGIEGGKDKEGRAAMLKLCKPNGKGVFVEDIKLYEALCKYCPRDVELEREIARRLSDMPEAQWQEWRLDQTINDRGIGIDTHNVAEAVNLIEHLTKIKEKQLSDLTKGELTDVRSLPKIKKYLKAKGIEVTSLAKDKLKEVISTAQGDPKFVLEMRAELGQTSLAKYSALTKATCTDGRMRGALFYHSAFTGRWGGRLVQPQNLPRGTVKKADRFIPYMNVNGLPLLDMMIDASPFDVLSSNVRSMFWAPEGKNLVIADFAAIEARVLMWLAKDPGIQIFRDNDSGKTDVDIYVHTARQIYGNPNLTKADKDERQLGKMAVLGCGYQMGAATFKKQAKAMWGMDLTDALANKVVNTYRSTYKNVMSYWYRLQRDAAATIQGRPTGGFALEGGFLTYTLPSGRKLYYYKPALKDGSIRYMSNDSMSKKLIRKDTYGGKLAENITQAVARDLMMASMINLEKEGYPIVLTVHDEIVCEVPESFTDVEKFEKIMCTLPSWAKDFPLAAEAEITKRYKK